MSSYCSTCIKLQKMHKNAEYVALKAHRICQCNYECSSAKMETIGVIEYFQDRQLKYTTYYGDGDSKGFLSVQNIYGINSVLKLECIGHIQKRVGSRLRKLK
ncbi:uncharacterized protein CDAR_496961 [Caerostris darwini]|uniref:Mutator-like transposase domain-containing protein n=1 Tax=Caerostris darwini TaxID=1538125 RepID=A0AAV4S0J8_9ARAC|nr:uncharacterized protein CDAR_496961 [Caerostris darwini]